MKKKNLLTLILILLVLLIGGAAVYVGLQISQIPTELPETGFLEKIDGLEANFHCPGGYLSYYKDDSLGTYCVTIQAPSRIGFISKHWCNVSTWGEISNGCNCPAMSSCAAVHYMANGSVYQKGNYSPNTAQCKCTAGGPSGTDCTSATAGDSCVINLFQNMSNPPQTICLDRVRGDRSKTFCGGQQIDASNVAGEKCYLSGLMANVPECQEAPPPTTPPIKIACEDWGCAENGLSGTAADALCEGWSTTNSKYECKEGLVNPVNGKKGQCQIVPNNYCPGQAQSGPCECNDVPVTTQPPVTTKPPVTTRPPVTTIIPPTTTVPPTTEPPITTMIPPTTQIPETALISDEVDRIIIGVSLLIIGSMIFSFNYHILLGSFLWKHNPFKSKSDKQKEFEDKF